MREPREEESTWPGKRRRSESISTGERGPLSSRRIERTGDRGAGRRMLASGRIVDHDHVIDPRPRGTVVRRYPVRGDGQADQKECDLICSRRWVAHRAVRRSGRRYRRHGEGSGDQDQTAIPIDMPRTNIDSTIRRREASPCSTGCTRTRRERASNLRAGAGGRCQARSDDGNVAGVG